MTLYLLCLLIGGALVLFSLLGGHDHDFHLGHPDSGDVASWFSLRALVFFLAFFGLAGVVFGWLGLSGAGQFGFALVAGLVVGFFAAWLNRLARGSETGTEAARLIGRTGRVLLPTSPTQTGKVELTVTGQSCVYLAQSPDELGVGEPIIVIAESGGQLQVRRWEGR